MSELEAVLPVPIALTVGGQALEIGELTVGKLTRFLRAGAPLLEALMKGGGLEVAELLRQGEAVTELVVIATELERATVEALPASELLRLLEAIVEANGRFFGEALPAFVTKLAAKGAATLAGSMPSSS